MGTELFVFFTHIASKTILAEANTIAKQLPRNVDFIVAGIVPNAHALSAFQLLGMAILPITRSELQSLPYTSKKKATNWDTLKGACDLGLMYISTSIKGYDNYWFCEYDVKFTGNMGALVEEFSANKSDLLCTHVVEYAMNPSWLQWSTLISPNLILTEDVLLGGFLPFCRVSHTLVAILDSFYRAGWAGHNEALWPTVARIKNLKIEEIGGRGKYTPENRLGKYYKSAYVDGLLFSTMHAWPCYSVRSGFDYCGPRDMLWHPVKE